MRLRVEWRDVKKAFLTAASPPPENHVSVARAIDFDIAHYTTEGPVGYRRDFDDCPAIHCVHSRFSPLPL